MSAKVAYAQDRVAAALADLEEPECRLTFVMRRPGHDDGYMITTNDPDLAEVERTIARERARTDR